MPAGHRRHLVTLEDKENAAKVFRPPTIYVALRPGPPSSSDESRNTFIVEAPYHPDITYNTVLLYGDRKLFVTGIENVDERERDLNLYCEEVKTP